MRIVIASNNPDKSRELEYMLSVQGFSPILQSSLSIKSVAETGKTFIENAILKARHAAENTGLPAIGDDSGLIVEALGGAPGIYSSHFAGSTASAQENIDKLLLAMEEVPEQLRQAKFQAVIVFLRHADDPTPIVSQGVWSGSVARQPSGTGGFCYDSIFFLHQYGCTVAEVTAELKNSISHRAIALHDLITKIKENV
jgi:XTP/dITP diphosphohydrolase